jgi:predicted dehydrogenase
LLKKGIGIIGLGGIAQNQMDAYRKRNFTVLAGQDVNAAIFPGIRQKFGVEHLTTDLQEFLATPGLEVVDVAVPHYFELRKPIFEAVAAAKKAIFCQKPLAESLQEALALVKIAEDAGVPLMVNQNAPFVPGFQEAERFLRDKERFGDPYYFQIENRAALWFTEHPHWGSRERWILQGMAVHHCALAQHWFGTPERVSALLVQDPTRPFVKAENIAVLNLEYAGGLKGVIINNWAYRGPNERGHPREEIIVLGTRGEINGDSEALHFSSRESGWELDPKIEGAWFNEAFGNSMQHFLECLESGAPFRSSGREDLKVMAVIEAGYRSALERKSVEIQALMQELGAL